MAKQQLEVTNAERLFLLGLLQGEENHQLLQRNPSRTYLDHVSNLREKLKKRVNAKWSKL